MRERNGERDQDHSSHGRRKRLRLHARGPADRSSGYAWRAACVCTRSLDDIAVTMVNLVVDHRPVDGATPSYKAEIIHRGSPGNAACQGRVYCLVQYIASHKRAEMWW